MADIAATTRYSGFWRRLGALIIDAIIVGVISGIIAAILRAVGANSTTMPGVLPGTRSWRQLMEEQIRRKILTLLDQHRIMTVATLRPDGGGLPQTNGGSAPASIHFRGLLGVHSR